MADAGPKTPPVQRQAGWLVVRISGSAADRGFAHGFSLAPQIAAVVAKLPFLCETILKISLEQYQTLSDTCILPIVKRDFAEWYDECAGIARGASAAGVALTPAFVVAWNSYESIYSMVVKQRRRHKCSAFIAVGSATATGEIVMSHNTHVDYVMGSFENIIMYVNPARGAAFVMQTSPGLICSVTDWFISASGMMGCETTISDISYKPVFGAPYFCRARSAMQYSRSIADFVRIMSRRNAGDYACSWLLGDTRRREIALVELGLRESNVLRTRDGIYFGMNSATGDALRAAETTDRTQFDIRTSSGARKLRFEQMLKQEYYGKITAANAKTIIADHYDVFLRKTRRNHRSVCAHGETGTARRRGAPEPKAYPSGCVDGKTVDAAMAETLSFNARWGSACGRRFDASRFIAKHPQFAKWKGVLEDLPTEAWTVVKP
jgi:hypothetical protein